MKKSVMLVLAGMLVCSPVFSAEQKEVEEPKYRVEMRVVYNAIEAERVTQLIKKALSEHSEACDVHFSVDDVNENSNGILKFYSSGANSTVTIPNVIR